MTIAGQVKYNTNIQVVTSGTTAARPTGLNATTDVGYSYFDTTLGAPIWWTGSAWMVASSPAQATVSITGTGAATSFTVTHNLALATPFQPSSVTVLDPNGKLLSPSSYDIGTLATNSFVVTFTVAPANGAVHRFRVTA
jgi:hypothetical protein